MGSEVRLGPKVQEQEQEQLHNHHHHHHHHHHQIDQADQYNIYIILE